MSAGWMRASYGSQTGECRCMPDFFVIILELQASKRGLVVAASLQ